MEWLTFIGENLPWQVYLAAAFFIMTSTALNLLAQERKDEIALWLMGAQPEESWSKSFLSLFDALFGKHHLSARCFARSCIASVLAVSGIWGLMAMTGTLETRFAGAMAWTEALAIGIAVNLMADYVSLLETRFLLSRMDRLRSFGAQALVLLADLILSAAIILVVIEVVRWTGVVAEDNTSWAAIGLAFSVYSAPFYSTFLTSVWTWVYILSTWVLRLFTGLGLNRLPDVEHRPTLMLSLTLSGFVLAGAYASSLGLERGGDGLSPLERTVCHYAKGDVCERLLVLTDNPTAKLTLALNACEGGVETRCMDEAFARYETDGQTAARFWRAACDRGNARGCSNLGVLYAQGLGVAQDAVQAAALYRQGCDGGNAPGCTGLGVLYAQGLGVAQDAVQAAALYRQGCDGGDARGCTNLGVLYEQGLGVAQDEPRALALYEQACDMGQATGCYYAGWNLRDGIGVARDVQAALTLFLKA